MSTEVPGYVSKTDLVAALVRELVISGDLEPGEQLRQRDLAQARSPLAHKQGSRNTEGDALALVLCLRERALRVPLRERHAEAHLGGADQGELVLGELTLRDRRGGERRCRGGSRDQDCAGQ